jgi:hypothetical protein
MAVEHKSFGEAMVEPGGLGNMATLGLLTDIGAIDYYGARDATRQAADVGAGMTPQSIG